MSAAAAAAAALCLPLFLTVSSSVTPPSAAIFLACGASSDVSFSGDNPPRTFTPDSSYLRSAGGSLSVANPTVSARAFTSPASYSFHLGSRGIHLLRLHFLPFAAGKLNLATARFDVSVFTLAATTLLLSNFSTNGGDLVIKEFFLWADNQLDLTFNPVNGLAFINAIELFPAPPELLNGADPSFVTPTGTETMDGYPPMAMETLYRINVGGEVVTPANDTLWRTWVPDERYLFEESLTVENSTAPAKVKYGTDPRRSPEVAPSAVYCTARRMNVPLAMRLGNPAFGLNLTWSFPVTAGDVHFVRMHFCDFVTASATELYFNVFLGSGLAYADLQPGSFTGQTPAAAFFLDFAVAADSSLLNVTLGRSSRSTPLTANAILNGLEIVRLLNHGDATGRRRRRRHVPVPVFVGSVLGGVVLVSCLVSALVFLLTRRRHSKPATETKGAAVPIPCSPFRGWAGNSISNATETPSPAPARAPTPTTPRTNLCLQIPLAEISMGTEGFDEKNVIGAGGFGKVYKGVLIDGTPVAVKRGMPGSKQGYPEFQAEVLLLSGIRHRHLVSLIGYCDEGGEMLLVYEYMENGPLKHHLYGGAGDCTPLPWRQRLEILMGAARGLHYLHTGHAQSVIHRDVKSSNVLLDRGWAAKVSDFGLSKAGPAAGETHVTTAVKGSFGYFDPEYFRTQKLTEKSDVYSFGVLMLEVLCGRAVIDPSLDRERASLSEWAMGWHRRGMLEKAVDGRIAGEVNGKSLRKFGETAARCLAEHGEDRPGMVDVLWGLEYTLQLQETQVQRQPYEDSGGIDVDMNVAVERSMSTHTEEEEDAAESIQRRRPRPVAESGAMFSENLRGEGRSF